MPIFEYACESCGHKFEKLLLNTRVEVECPTCNGKSLRKLFSVFASVSNSSDQMPCFDGMAGGGCGMPGGGCGMPGGGCGMN